jgi:ribosomal protein S18 acetylase RimI-like enzyme
MERIAGGETLGVLALEGEKLVGLGTFLVGDLSSFPLGADFVAVHSGDMVPVKLVGYVAEVVVHTAYGGRGIGSRLLEEVKERLRRRGVEVIYLKRHEENLRSAAIIRKAGFQEVAVFDDPQVRKSGSRRTSVSRFEFRVKNGVPGTIRGEERISP